MGLAVTLKQYLASQGVSYDLVGHSPAPSASRTAQASHVSGEMVAKGVVVKDARGYLVAVLPATHHLRLDELRRSLDREVELAREEDLSGLFRDCDAGAVPAIGGAYGLEVIVDESLVERAQIYFEAGDHETLVRVSGPDFAKLTSGARRGRFSSHD